jgi:titin
MTTQHGIQLAWQDTTPGATFNVYRSTTSGGEAKPPLVTGLTALSYLDASGTPGTQYFYEVTAVLGGIESAPSAEAGATFPTVPSSPTNLTAVPI